MERDAALEAVFMPVRPASTFEETVERLGSAIRLGLLAPGDKLPPERELVDHGAWAVLDYRVAIESGAALLAAERGSEENFDRLDELVEKMAGQLEDFEEYRFTDIRFHIGVAEAAHSPRLLSAMTDVQAQMSSLIDLIAHPPEVLTISNEQHARLVKALRKGDGLRAVRQMREHTEGTEHILAGLLPAPLSTGQASA
jgi:GntR family transcriptional repressor for pyruvate dehydrogenase complex